MHHHMTWTGSLDRSAILASADIRSDVSAGIKYGFIGNPRIKYGYMASHARARTRDGGGSHESISVDYTKGEVWKE